METGAIPALRGYRIQFLYTLYRILIEENPNISFKPEGKEDLDIYLNNNLVEVIQVKDYSEDLTLSHLKPENENGFLSRCIDVFDRENSVRVKLVSFGLIGNQLKNAFKKQKPSYETIRKNLKKHSFENKEIDNIFKIKLEEKSESDLTNKIKKKLKENPRVQTSIGYAFDWLIYWLYEVAEKQKSITQTDLLDKLNQLGTEISEVENRFKQFGKSILDIKNQAIELSKKEIEKFSKDFYIGVSAQPEHIFANVDAIRENRLKEINEKFEENNILIIHGNSGQGKSTLAYRYLLENQGVYEIKFIENETQASSIISTIKNLAKTTNIPLIFYIDIESSSEQYWKVIAKEIAKYPEKLYLLITVREEDYKQIYAKDFQFSEIELLFDETEARIIFQKLEKKESIRKFPKFEDAWLNFGQKGNLLEFVYLITQGIGLKDRLEEQINNFVNTQDKKVIDFLRIVILTDIFRTKVYLKKIATLLDLEKPQLIIQNLEKEYFIRQTENKQFVTGLHPLRSEIISQFDVLFDETFHPIDTYFIKCLKVISDIDLEVFLLNLFFDNDLQGDVFEYLISEEPESWTAYGNILRALLWFGIKEYVNNNSKVFENAELL